MIQHVKSAGHVTAVVKGFFLHKGDLLALDTNDQIILVATMQQPEILAPAEEKPRRGRPRGTKKVSVKAQQVVNGQEAHPE